jgi:elongation factor G
MVDLVEMKAYEFEEENRDYAFRTYPPEAELLQSALDYRKRLIEEVVSYDDDLMARYLEEEDLDEALIRRAVRKATLECHIQPVFCGAALRNKGVRKLLDGVTEYLPSPLDRGGIAGMDAKKPDRKAVRKPDREEPFCALGFKVASDPHVESLTYLRIYSGKIEKGETAYNPRTKKRERLGRILKMHSNKREDINEAEAGMIVAAVGLKGTVTGDTLCDAKHPIVLESMQFPQPVIDIAIEPKTQADQEKLLINLKRLAREDPTFRIKQDEDTGQTIISGMGELHLDVLVKRLINEFRIKANVGSPQVSFRETIKLPVEKEVRFSQQMGGHNHFGHVVISLEPLAGGAGYEFEDAVPDGQIRKDLIPVVRQSARETLDGGILAGYQVINVRIRLTGGSMHENDSSELGFRIATSQAVKAACRKAGPVLLEPVMSVEVVTPEAFVGNIIADLNARGGKINNIVKKDDFSRVQAKSPLGRMFGYATALRSASQGRATFTMEFFEYSEVPKETLRRIMGF